MKTTLKTVLIWGLLWSIVLLFLAGARADTPPPGTVKAKVFSGDGSQAIGNVSDALKVNVTNPGGGTQTVNQGTTPWVVGGTVTANQGSPPWTFSLPPDAATETTLETINLKIPSGLTVSSTRLLVDPGTVTVTGSLGRTWNLSSGADSVSALVSNFPASFGASQVGSWSVTAVQGTSPWVSSISNFPATQAVTQSTSPWVVGGTVNSVQSGAWTTGRTWSLLSSTDSVDVGNFPASFGVTQLTSPWVVSGTVTATNSANGNTGAAAPAQATQVGGSDGTDLRAIKVDSAGIVSVDDADIDVALSTRASETTLSSINVKIPSGLTVTGSRLLVDPGTVTVNQGTSPWVISGNVNASQSGAWTTGRTWTLLNSTDSVNVGNFPATYAVTQSTSPWVTSVSNFPATQAVTQSTSPWVVSGTVTANQGGTWTTGRTWSLLHSTDSVRSRMDDGSGVAITSQVNGAQRALDVGIDVAGVQVDPRSIRALSSGTDSVAVTGSVTANAGTNLNTSALALSATQTNGTQKTQIVDGAGAVVGPIQAISGTNYEPVVLAASAIPGSPVVARSIQMAGSDGTNARTLSTDSTGAVNTNTQARTGVQLVRNDYTSTNVTTAAYVQLIASTSDTTNQIYIFDSSGQELFLATGAAASEVNKYYVIPGGNGLVNLTIPAGTRVSVKAVTATASVGEISLTLIK